MSDISLSRGIRQNLLSLQRTADLQAQTQNRLATGRKVNSALDDPANFFVSEGLKARASDLSRLLDSMGLGVKTLEAADAGITGLKKLVETAQGLARQARQTADAPTRLSLAAQFDVIRTQIDQLAGDSAYNGVNLIGATPDNLTVVFNETNSTSLTITGVALGTTGLGIAACGEQLGGQCRHRRGNRGPRRRDNQAALAGLDFRRQPDRAEEPAGLHAQHDAGARHRRRRARARRSERGGSESPRPQHPSAAVADGAVAGRAGRSSRAPAVRLKGAQEPAMTLKVELRPGERIIVGTAVIRNGESRARLHIEGEAPILREKDILTPATADSPAKKIYLAVQLMYLTGDLSGHNAFYFPLVQEFLKAAPSALPLIAEVNNRILAGDLYKALKAVRQLITYEQELIAHAAGGERVFEDRAGDTFAP